MSERWIPIVAAILGVLGGTGGAFIGGHVANEGQAQRFVKAGGLVQMYGKPSQIAEINAAEARVSLLTSSPEVRREASEFRSVALADHVSGPAFRRARDGFLDVAYPELDRRSGR